MSALEGLTEVAIGRLRGLFFFTLKCLNGTLLLAMILTEHRNSVEISSVFTVVVVVAFTFTKTNENVWDKARFTEQDPLTQT